MHLFTFLASESVEKEPENGLLENLVTCDFFISLSKKAVSSKISPHWRTAESSHFFGFIPHIWFGFLMYIKTPNFLVVSLGNKCHSNPIYRNWDKIYGHSYLDFGLFNKREVLWDIWVRNIWFYKVIYLWKYLIQRSTDLL